MMRNSCENKPATPRLAVSNEAADFHQENHKSPFLNQPISNVKQRKEQQNYHKKIEQEEKEKLNILLEREMDQVDLESFVFNEFGDNELALQYARDYIAEKEMFGITITKELLRNSVNKKLENRHGFSIKSEIVMIKKQLTKQGKSTTEILQILIVKFENEESVSTWVSNWKSYLALHQYAQTKSFTEKQAIENIITKADFTKENAFASSLSQISKSSEISIGTKLEITQKYNTENIATVGAMDNTLKQIQTRKMDIEKAIYTKKKEKKSLKSEIENLENQLGTLPPHDPKRKEIDAKLIEKTEKLKDTETTIQTLVEETPKDVSIPLRVGFTAKLNPNGTRTIEIDNFKFSVQLPENRLFMSRKNMLSINLAFVYSEFSLNGMERVFIPNLKSGAIPDKKNRLLGSRILKQLGYPINVILSQANIFQLHKDLGKLKQQGSNSAGIEDLEVLGIMDVKQEVNISRLNACLSFIRENRGRQIGFEEVREHIR